MEKIFEKIYCISGQGTVWANPEVLARNGVEEIICLRVVGGLYYSPELHVAFERRCEPEDASEYHRQYLWDDAVFPAYDERFKEIKEMPFWRMSICRIDLPKQSMTEEEALEAL